MKLETTYLGLSLAHPVIAGASPLSATFDGVRRLEDGGAAAVVTASIYEEEIAAERAALEAFGVIGAESHPEVTSYLPPQAAATGALVAHLELIRRAADSVSVPVIASLNGITREGWTGIAADLQTAGAAAIELDLFHLAADPGESSAEVERQLVETVREVCASVDIPVAVKSFPYFTAPLHLAAALAEAGARGIVLFNRYLAPDIDLDRLASNCRRRRKSACH
jgi:dihydroorotate dehydrogenase (fumarate)